MKTAELRKYRKNIEELEAIDRLLSEKVVVDSVQASRGAPDYALTHRKIEDYGKDTETKTLLKAKSNLQREQTAIKLFIVGIKNRRIYDALYHYCLDESLKNPTWDDVADKLHEDSPQALRIAVDRYLEKNS